MATFLQEKKQRMPLSVRTTPNCGKGLYLSNATLRKGQIVTRMRSPRVIRKSEWDNRRHPNRDKDRIRLFGRWYPDDVGVHGCRGSRKVVIYDEAMRHTRLKYARKKPKPLTCGDETLMLYDDTLDGRVPLWYRLNHSESPNVSMQSTVAKDGQIEVQWVALHTIVANRYEPVELTFHYGVVPSWFKK